jgi:CelD/BcsL family acetyltransferase involved in cellulose biosynthesis
MREAQFSFAIEPVERLYRDKPAWQALARSAIEPNPHYEPEFLMATACHLGRPGAIRLALVRDLSRENRLVALFPLETPRLGEGILFGAKGLHASPYVSLTTPLLDRDIAADALTAMLDGLAARPELPEVLHFPILAEKRAFAEALRHNAARAGRGMLVVARHERAAIDSPLLLPAYARQFGRATRKALARKAQRLAALGTLAFEVIGPDEPESARALADFLALEASGWKGKRGTALASRAATASFAREAFAGPMPAIVFERLTLDGAPIAMNLNLVASGVSYALKSAYDERFSAYSPGMLLDRFSLERVLDDPAMIRADSCAKPGHPIGSLWRERETIVSLLLALPSGAPATILEPIAARMHLASRLRAFARDLRDRLSRGWLS